MERRSPTRGGEGVGEPVQRVLQDDRGRRIAFTGRQVRGGGMGAVAEGRCDACPGEVILKELRHDYDERESGWRTLMASECGMLSHLGRHGYRAPRVVAQGDFRAGREGLWFLMTRAAGVSLEEWLAANADASEARKLALLEELAETVAALHRLGVVHLDLKPRNIFVDDRRGRRPVVELIDFGSARFLAGGGRNGEDNAVSFDYAAPEQLAQLGRCREAADHFVLGVLCAQVLTGTLPFGNIPRTRDGGLKALLGGDRQMVEARLRASGVSEGLAKFIVERLLSFDAGPRGAGMAAELAARLRQEGGAGRRRGGKRWAWRVAAGVCGLALVLYAVPWKTPEKPPDKPSVKSLVKSNSTGADASNSPPALYTNDSSWSVAFVHGADTKIVPPGGVIGTNWIPFGAQRGGARGEAWGLANVQAPWVLLNLSDALEFKPEPGERVVVTTNKLRGVQFQLPAIWARETDEARKRRIESRIVFKRGRASSDYTMSAPLWREEGFVAGRTNVFQMEAFPKLMPLATLHVNNSRWPVAFSNGNETRIVPSGGTIDADYNPVGAELGDEQQGNARVLNLETIRAPEVELRLSGPVKFEPPDGEWTIQTQETEYGTVVHYWLPGAWAGEGMTDEERKARVAAGVVPRDGSSTNEFEWKFHWESESSPMFVSGRMVVLTAAAARRPEIHVKAANGTPNLRLDAPAKDWERAANGNFMPPRGMEAREIRDIVQGSVRLADDRDSPDDYLWKYSWWPQEPPFASGTTCTLTVEAVPKPDAVNELRNGSDTKTILVNGRKLPPGQRMDLDTLQPELSVEDNLANQWRCEIQDPDPLLTEKGATNTYTVILKENAKPVIAVTNSGTVGMAFKVEGKENKLGLHQSMTNQLTGETETLSIVFTAAVPAVVTNVYEWTSQTATVKPKWGAITNIVVALEQKQLPDSKLQLDNPNGVPVKVALSGTHHTWTAEDGWGTGGAWTTNVDVPAGGTSVGIPRTVVAGGVSASWEAKEDEGKAKPKYKKGGSAVTFDTARLDCTLQFANQDITVTNASRIPLKVWLAGQDESRGRTIARNGNSTFPWQPTGNGAAPRICYQPDLKNHDAWYAWGWTPTNTWTTGNRILGVKEVSIDTEFIAEVVADIRAQLPSLQGDTGQSGNSGWRKDHTDNLRILKQSGVRTADVRSVSWPDFRELVDNLRKWTSEEQVRDALQVLGYAADWDDFMALP